MQRIMCILHHYEYMVMYIYYFTIYTSRTTEAFLENIPPDYTLEPLRYEGVSGEETTITDYHNLNFRRHGRELLLEGNYTFTQDLDNTFMRTIDSYVSPSGVGEFKQMPFKIPETSLCDFYNTSYRTYIEPHFLGKTNFPQIPPKGLCPIPAGNYWVKNVIIDENVLPKHVPRGLWRIDERVYHTKPTRKLVGGFNFYIRVVDRIK